MFFLLYKRTDNGIFDDFPRISKDFPKLSQDRTNVPEHFPRNTEDVRRLPKTFEGDQTMFR